MSGDRRLERLFPRLASSGYAITSPVSRQYNCIAWAAGDTAAWWEPDPAGLFYWPPEASRGYSLDAYIEALGSRGFVRCESGEMEPGFEKVALFADSAGVPTHAARRLPNGRWTSKLGSLQDIEHELGDVSSEAYGTVVLFMRRPA